MSLSPTVLITTIFYSEHLIFLLKKKRLFSMMHVINMLALNLLEILKVLQLSV